jgi:hypothetical protein
MYTLQNQPYWQGLQIPVKLIKVHLANFDEFLLLLFSIIDAPFS